MEQQTLSETPSKPKKKTLAPIINKPKGAAGEYGELAANLYDGCPHGCIYCYVPTMPMRSRATFHVNLSIKQDALERLEKNCAKYAGMDRTVFLSFTTDPYQPIEDQKQITREAIRILNDYDIGANILTKGGLRAVKDFDLLRLHPGNKFGVTLTTDNPETSQYWEPNAAPQQERIESLKIAKQQGISTWVSFEPVIDPGAVYRMIDVIHPFVDMFKVGKLNKHEYAKRIDWVDFHSQVIVKLKEHGCTYYIKDDLAKAARGTA